MRHPLVSFCGSLLALSLSVTGCDGDGAADAGPPAMDAGEPAGLFAPCSADSDCGEGSICRTSADGFPGGYCTVECTDRTPCDDGFVYNHCLARGESSASYCELRCLNGLDCGRDGWTCLPSFGDGSGACIPVCESDDQCGNGASCNVYTGECTTDAIPTTGATVGQTCADDDACRSGSCAVEINQAGDPTGFLGGYCVGNCILPAGYNTNTFYDGDALPNAGCPDDGVCLPRSFGAASQFDLGTCYGQCMGDGDCRPGYTCRQEFSAGGGNFTYTNGICLPINCATTACPTGYECVTLNPGTDNERNVCGPETPPA